MWSLPHPKQLALSGPPTKPQQVEMLAGLVEKRRLAYGGCVGFCDNFGDPVNTDSLEHIVDVIRADGIFLAAPLGYGYSKLVFATNKLRESRPQVLRLLSQQYREHYANHIDVLQPNEVREKDNFFYELVDWMDFTHSSYMLNHLKNRAKRAGYADPEALDINERNIGWTLRQAKQPEKPQWRHQLAIGDGTPWPTPDQEWESQGICTVSLYSVHHVQRGEIAEYALEERNGPLSTFASAKAGSAAWIPGVLPESLLYDRHHLSPLAMSLEETYVLSARLAEPELARFATLLDRLNLPGAPLPLVDHFPSRPYFASSEPALGL